MVCNINIYHTLKRIGITIKILINTSKKGSQGAKLGNGALDVSTECINANIY